MQVELHSAIAVLACLRQCREDESLECVDGGCSINDSFCLRDFAVICYFIREAVLFLSELVDSGVLQMLPEICSTEDNMGTVESFLERLEIVEVSGYEFDALVGPFGCGGFAGVAGDAANVPARLIEKDTGDG